MTTRLYKLLNVECLTSNQQNTKHKACSYWPSKEAHSVKWSFFNCSATKSPWTAYFFLWKYLESFAISGSILCCFRKDLDFMIYKLMEQVIVLSSAQGCPLKSLIFCVKQTKCGTFHTHSEDWGEKSRCLLLKNLCWCAETVSNQTHLNTAHLATASLTILL